MRIPLRSVAQARFMAFTAGIALWERGHRLSYEAIRDILADALGYGCWEVLIQTIGAQALPHRLAIGREARRATIVQRLARRLDLPEATLTEVVDRMSEALAAPRRRRAEIALARRSPIPWQPQNRLSLEQHATLPDGTLILERPELHTGMIPVSFIRTLPGGPRAFSDFNGTTFRPGGESWSDPWNRDTQARRHAGIAHFADRAMAIHFMDRLFQGLHTPERSLRLLANHGFTRVIGDPTVRYARTINERIYEIEVWANCLSLDLYDPETQRRRTLAKLMTPYRRKDAPNGGSILDGDALRRVTSGHWPGRVGRHRAAARTLIEISLWADQQGYSADPPVEEIECERHLRASSASDDIRTARPFITEAPGRIETECRIAVLTEDSALFDEHQWWAIRDGTRIPIADYLSDQDGIGGYHIGDWFWVQERWAHRKGAPRRRTSRVIYETRSDGKTPGLNPAETMVAADSRRVFRIDGLSLKPLLDATPWEMSWYERDRFMADHLAKPSSAPGTCPLIVLMDITSAYRNIVSSHKAIAAQFAALRRRDSYEPWSDRHREPRLRHTVGVEVVPPRMTARGWTKDVEPGPD